ncbi:proteasome component pup2 [Mycoemilia scoparia]|uniref:Proteasome subunit alpha type n=1 Tax=Mycoemilia scoparia TaxID=417184 RepID=A0A9W8A7R5_9FUNG|nr:proteasome component pup2 [Mycoemilia scoparia]
MSEASRSDYDRGVNTFSPEGRFYQVEYALEAIKLGSTAIGIQTSEGAVLAAEKRVTSSLLVPSSIEKIVKIDDHVGCAVAGLTPDSRIIIEHARGQAQSHKFTYDEPILVRSVSQSVCDLALQFGESVGESKPKMSRPFGVALLIAGMDEDEKPSLYHCEPTGTLVKTRLKAIGGGQEGAQSKLEADFEKDYNENPTLEQAKHLALKVLKEVMEDKITKTNIELSFVTMGEIRGKKAPLFQYENEEALGQLIERIEREKREQDALEFGESGDRMEEDH